jgi:hypothetical protein
MSISRSARGTGVDARPFSAYACRMSANRLRISGAFVGVLVALSSLSFSLDAAAQATPGAAPHAAPAGAPPATTPPPSTPPGSAPPAEGTAPTPGEPPPPLAASPLVTDEPPPPPPTVEDTALPPPPPPPDEPPPPRRSAGPFARGSVRLSVLIGTGSTINDTYLILGGGVGYYLLDGLEFGLDYEAWILAEPVMNRLSPGLRYVFHMIPVIKPYIGGFYRHTFIGSDYEDSNSLGVRGGIYYVPPNGGLYVGGGAVYEHLLGCTNSAFIDCDSVYPEIFVGVTF